jgi:ubiquinone/menaquinone biosynthesis C-methylase UbiE
MEKNKKQAKQDYYSSDKVVSEYDHKRFLRGGGVYVAKKETEIIQYFLTRNCNKNSIVLDCPVGTGRFLPLINQITENIIAADISEAMLKNASRFKAKKFIRSSAEKLPIEENSIDFWISSRFFFHFMDLDVFFKEANRVLKPGGYFVFDVFNWSPRSLLPEFLMGGQTYNHKQNYIKSLSIKYHFDILEDKQAFFIPTYIASFMPNLLVTFIEDLLDRISFKFKTKSYFLLVKI